MKNLISTICKTTVVLFAALLVISCGNDGNNNDIVLTEGNYIYEGDLYKSYLSDTIAVTVEKIAELEAITPNDPNYNQAKADLVIAKQLQITLNSERVGILDIVGFNIPRPNPCPKPRTCFPIDFQFMVIPDHITSLIVTAYNSKDEVVGNGDSNIMLLPDVEGLNVIKITTNGYKGEGYVKVTKKDTQGVEINYREDGDFQ